VLFRSSLSEAESTLREKHFTAAETLIRDEKLCEATKAGINTLIQSLVDLCKAIAVLGEASPRAMDAVVSLGERMSIRLLGAVVNDAGIHAKAVESTEFIVTNANYQNAHPDFTVGTGVPPVQSRFGGSRGLSPPIEEFHLTPKNFH